MKKIALFLLLLFISITTFADENSKAETTKTETAATQSTENSSKENTDSIPSTNNDLKDKISDKVTIKDSETGEEKTIRRLKEANESTTRPTEVGRVLWLPGGGIHFFITDNSKSDMTFLIDSDFEYQTGLMSQSIALFGNAGLGFSGSNFIMQFQIGLKYKFQYIEYNLKPFLKVGVSFAPVFDEDAVTLFSGFLGAGFQYFLDGESGVELSTDFHTGGFFGEDSLLGMYVGVRLSYILVF
ncbi:hypothetical protein JXR93_14295 [bacterium]|nr:hypothetical protein [bacterium]